jgi:hypothetical protein
MTAEETVVLPPSQSLKRNLAIQERLDALDKLEKADTFA